MREDPARLEFEIEARDGAARTGRLRTVHGEVATPAFIPLATRGAVRSLTAVEVAGLGYELILANTFHLFLAPGAERITALGGLHRFIGWERALITDSGGFQVFSLAHGTVADEIKGRRGGAGGSGGVLEISERGVAFRSYVDGSKRFMGPEESMATQAALGSDIALAFDECTPYHADRDYTARSTERTHRWLDRCLEWHARHGAAHQAVFGIVQGGVDPSLRRASVAAIGALAFDGIAIGGLSVGESKADMAATLEVVADALGDDLRPRYLMGVGSPADFFTAVERGVDLFDCVLPTRVARTGQVWTDAGRLNLRNAALQDDPGPIDAGCACEACRNHSRAYLAHLFRARELLAYRLASVHNVTWTLGLMRRLRASLADGSFAALREGVVRAFGRDAAG